ncbi:class I tRNA ligase family protein [Candidatus Azambacteria bacterium]|nr:class I tRNA ligase family protein [Candidatus Azambacteria bacterium]
MSYDHKKLARKWARAWVKNKKLYAAQDGSKKPKRYVLDMFPYPSGEGLHVGHTEGEVATDIYARFLRMQGYNVLHPMGWDAFGLPAENFAIKNKVHPAKVVKKNVANFKKQMDAVGLGYDWAREINTTDPDYYRWTQWIFLKLFERGLAYEAEVPINFCPSCKTALANEEVVGNGVCERCGTVVERRNLRQWMLKITTYADRLLKDLDGLEWSEQLKSMQRNWIGRSEGAELDFRVYHEKQDKVLFACINEKGETLLERRKGGAFAGKWLFPGGKIEREDTDMVQAAMREIEEEAGFGARDVEYLGFLGYFHPKAGKGNIPLLVFRMKKKNAKPAANTGHELKWQSVDEMPKEYGHDEFVEMFEGVRDAVKTGRVFPSAVSVFTTRADTLYGATYAVLAPEHPLVQENILGIENYKEVSAYVVAAKNKSDLERTAEAKGKTGVRLEGVKAVNPANGRAIPVYVADYVLGGYGTGAVMAVPAHDERDFAFAQAHGLPIEDVVVSADANCIIVHGSPQKDRRQEAGYLPDNERHWLPWLKETMEARGVKTFAPSMPTPWAPRHEEWKKEFEKLPVGEQSILVGHSAACSFLMRWLGERKRKVKKLILIAPSKVLKGEETARLEELYAFDIDASVRTLADDIEIIVADDDIDRIKESARLFGEALGVKPLWLPHGGHFTFLAMGTHEFPEALAAATRMKKAFTDDGVLIRSGKFTGMTSAVARTEIVRFVKGKEVVNYKLHDWIFARQRYWGEPFPLVFCECCADEVKSQKSKVKSSTFSKGELLNPGWIAVPEKQLPVKLPNVKSYEPSGTGESPLAKIDTWVKTKCPRCGGPARRETNTMPQWAGSCWYYLRFMDPKNKKALVDPKKEKYWSPVDVYVGGAEHAVLHLLYARFWHKVLYDIGIVSKKEPFHKLINQGLILGPDKQKMSKSKGNVINPITIVDQHGADVLRMYEMFMGPLEDAKPWDTQGIAGIVRFLERVHKIVRATAGIKKATPAKSQNSELERSVHKTIKKATEDIEHFHFNTAISALMILLNEMEKQSQMSKINCQMFVLLLAPFAPFLAEEMWEILGKKGSVHAQTWPKFDKKLVVENMFDLVIQINGKVRDVVRVQKGISESEAMQQATASENVKKHIEGKEICKKIFVPDRLINIII